MTAGVRPEQFDQVPAPQPPRGDIQHVITGMGVGGAQSMLIKLLERREISFAGYEQSVLSLATPDAWQARITGLGVRLETIGMRRGMPDPAALLRLRAHARGGSPDLIVGWMHHGAVAAWRMAAMCRRRPPVVWNIRHSLDDLANESPTTRLLLRYAARISGRVDAIIFNSRNAQRQYRAIGFDLGRAHVIPNGFDCVRYRPRREAKARLAARFGVERTVPVVGMVARHHPMKDPQMLIDAVRLLRRRVDRVHLLVAGPGMDDPRKGVAVALAEALPPGSYTLLGERADVAELLPGLDLLALSSAWGEAFPNILGEAMASGVPCVATDVGDAAWIVGDTGRIVPPGDPQAMSEALHALLALPEPDRRALGLAARDRVSTHFSMAQVAGDYAALYDRLTGAGQDR